MNNPKIFDTVQDAKQYALEVCKYADTIVLGDVTESSKWAVCGICNPPKYCHSKDDAANGAVLTFECEDESDYVHIPNETALIYKL